jgi:LytR cell envelope-related transcriptional attenuator
VTKGKYPYPPDEFDDVGAKSGPRGVHRRSRSLWTRAWPFLAILVLFPAVAYGLVTVLSNSNVGLPGLGSESSAAASSTAPSAAASSDTAAPTPAPTASAPAATGTGADLTTAVVVFNSTSTSGLAAKGAAALTAAHFTKVSSGNYTGGTLPTSTVFYATKGLEATAQAAAKALGITTVTLDPAKAGKTIAVVLEKDYKP